jgi:hypothetical protein
VDTRTFAQKAYANTVYDLSWPGVDVTVRSTMRLDVTPASYDVSIWTQAVLDSESISERSWKESIPR